MTLKQIKEKMLNWKDFYGQDFVNDYEIKKAKTKEQLKKIIQGHIHFLENQAIDAQQHALEFKKELGLNQIF